MTFWELIEKTVQKGQINAGISLKNTILFAKFIITECIEGRLSKKQDASFCDGWHNSIR
jgi:hypothetical protein